MSRSPLDVYLFGRNWQRTWADVHIDMPRLWQVIDKLSEDESKLLYLLWDKDGFATELTQKDAIAQLGVNRYCLEKAIRRLRYPERRKYYVLRDSVRSTEYGYA
jgi:hypothetical protein